MLVIKAGIHKVLVTLANRGDPDQTASKQSDLGLHCLSKPLWHTTRRLLRYMFKYSKHFSISVLK